MALVPPAVVTFTWTVPALPAGAIAVMLVFEVTVKLEAAVVPKLTAVAPLKLVPLIVTDVPPAVEPELGEIPVIVGAAT